MFFNNLLGGGWKGRVSALSSALSRAVPDPSTMPPISEDRLPSFLARNINENDAKMIRKTIEEHRVQWIAGRESERYIEKRKGTHVFLPKNLYYKTNSDVEQGVEVFIHCENCVVGSGCDMTYEKALEYWSLKTYVLGITVFQDEIVDGEFRSGEDRQEAANHLKNAFDRVKDHPQVVKLHSVFHFSKNLDSGLGLTQCMGFVFEYCNLGDLEQFQEKGGSLAGREVEQILIDVASGLEYLHSVGLAHYDMKEANILLARDEDGKIRAKVGDLGFAGGPEAYSGNGTPIMLPPEYWAGYPHKSEKDYRALNGFDFDKWAYGDVMKWLVSGQHFIPDDAIAVAEAKGDLESSILALKNVFMTVEYPVVERDEEETVGKLCRHLLQLAPKDRPASMTEVRVRLEAIHAQELIVTGSVSEVEGSAKPLKITEVEDVSPSE